ncbi:MAG: RIO kinase [Monoraphidium minutum]|nr:MAG: RIO kinase [Monoraphidium minutum]
MAVEAPSLEVLQARYEDSEDEEVDLSEQHAPLSGHAAGSAAAAAAAQAAAGVTAAAAPAADAPAAEGGEGGERGGFHYAVDEEEDGYDEEDYEEDWSDDGDVGAALDWAESREGHMAKGHAAQAAFHGAARGPNAGGGAGRHAPGAGGAQLQPRAGGGNLQKLESRFCVRDDPLDGLCGMRLSAAVSNEVRAGAAKVAAARVRAGDKSDRATVEQALDPRTRMVLFKMLNRGVFREIHGCISTGKEANVYHATGGGGPYPDLAIKVYKTSILVFKDRDRYVTGDFRFRSGYCRSNPRKMVWAEKEMRNLSRLRAAGIRAPAPLMLRMHVLVMEFVGDDSVAAPRLKDANLPLQRLCSAYGEMVSILRTLYQRCRLVHADLSEYNILVHRGELVIIDVSQAVDLDHPKALDFLREDAKHVNDFFRRAGVAVLSTRELFDYVVDASITAEMEEEALAALQQLAASRPLARNAEEEVEEAIFAQAFIPRKLEEVAHYERDREALAAGKKVEGLYYQAITGMADDLSGPRAAPMALAQRREKLAESERSSSGSGSGEDGEGRRRERGEPKDKDAEKAARKAHKKETKEANRERRKSKIPKHVKKKHVKKSGKKK